MNMGIDRRPVGGMRLREVLPAILFLLALAGIWEAVVRALAVPVYLLPPPSGIGRALAADFRLLCLTHLPATLGEALAGLACAAAAGLLLGALIHQWVPLRRTLYPLLVISQTIPVIILAPLLVVWFGYGFLPKLVVVTLACFFPVAVNTFDGLAGTDADMIKLVRSLGAGAWQVFRLVRLPAALPQVLSGVRVAASYAVMAAVVAEWMGADRGLGVYIMRSAHSFRTAQVFSGIILVSLFSVGLFRLVELVQRLLLPWYAVVVAGDEAHSA